MGAEQFITRSKGLSAKAAFHKATSDAQYENGHGGYTGTIAEKDSFRMVTEVTASSVQEAGRTAQRLLDEDDGKYGDKWGPAFCIAVEGTDDYVFFGWASS